MFFEHPITLLLLSQLVWNVLFAPNSEYKSQSSIWSKMLNKMSFYWFVWVYIKKISKLSHSVLFMVYTVSQLLWNWRYMCVHKSISWSLFTVLSTFAKWLFAHRGSVTTTFFSHGQKMVDFFSNMVMNNIEGGFILVSYYLSCWLLWPNVEGWPFKYDLGCECCFLPLQYLPVKFSVNYVPFGV